MDMRMEDTNLLDQSLSFDESNMDSLLDHLRKLAPKDKQVSSQSNEKSLYIFKCELCGKQLKWDSVLVHSRGHDRRSGNYSKRHVTESSAAKNPVEKPVNKHSQRTTQ